MTTRIKKYLLGILALSAVFVLGFNIWRYLTYTYFPLKEAQPIIEKLTSADLAALGEALLQIRGYTSHSEDGRNYQLIPIEDHKPLRGAGEEKVRFLLLDMLATTTNRNVLDGVLFMCTTDEGVDLANTNEEARTIIADAIERYNKPHLRLGYELQQLEDGRWAVLNTRTMF